MRRTLAFIFTLLISTYVQCQNLAADPIQNAILNLGEVHDSNENFEGFSALKTLLKDVEIVMLGEQSHGEATVYDTKIKLIKYLHQEMGYDLLLFESGFYDCHKAWQMIQEGESVRIAMGNSIFPIWSTTKDFKPLANYLESEKDSKHPLQMLGFDNQLTSHYAKQYFIQDLTVYLNEVKPVILTTKEWEHFHKNIALLVALELKELRANAPQQDLDFLQNLVCELEKTDLTPITSYWIQTLTSTRSYMSDVAMKLDDRDKQMADNLKWIKEKYPNRKIICWGATSHFLYNSQEVKMKSALVQFLGGKYYKKQPMMGEYVKEEYKEKAYTIGFTAYEGEFGLLRKGQIKTPKKGSLEYLLGNYENDNFLLPFQNLDLSGYPSRPLGNRYMTNDIDDVMDAVIFNRVMRRPKLDRNFFLTIYPDNKYVEPEVVE